MKHTFILLATALMLMSCGDLKNRLDDLEGRVESLEKQCERNEWIESENDELGKRLQEQMEQSIALSRENSHLKAANNILQRKLDTSRMAVPEGI